jgi:hypothetical protein
MKSYTDLEQSKALAKILPLESADMYYWCANHYPKEDWIIEVGTPDDNYECISAWSLAALLNVLPNNEHITTSVSRGSWQIEPINYLPNTWWCEYEDNESLTEFNVSADNSVDACVAMIEKLHELKML